MLDPVVASDGESYERTAIERWLKDKDTSPAHGSPLDNKNLTPNHRLKSAIQAHAPTSTKLDLWKRDHTVYKNLDSIRARNSAALKSCRQDELAEAAKKHNKSARALKHATSICEYDQLLQEQNVVKLRLKSQRTLIFLDATNSMGRTLDLCKQRIAQVFSRTSQVLEKENVNAGFEISIAAFRNYNSDLELLLEPSPWEANPDVLQTFLGRIHCDGGCGNEAIEVALWHANNEHAKQPVSQVLLIGDAPSNTPDEVTSKRKYMRLSSSSLVPTAYWRARAPSAPDDSFWINAQQAWCPSGVPRVTAEEEAKSLGSKGVPIHAFYVADRAQECFERLANLSSGGKAAKLDIYSDKGADMLSESIIKKILEAIESGTGSKGRLTKVYDQMFKPAFSRSSKAPAGNGISMI